MFLFKNRFVKSFIFFLSFFFLIFSSIKPQRAYANPAIVIGGLEITGEAIVALGACSLYAGGAILDATDGTDARFLNQLGSDLVATGKAANYLGVKTAETGQKMLTWTTDGFDWFKGKMADTLSTDTFDYPISNGVELSLGSSLTSTSGHINFPIGTISGVSDGVCLHVGGRSYDVSVGSSYSVKLSKDIWGLNTGSFSASINIVVVCTTFPNGMTSSLVTCTSRDLPWTGSIKVWTDNGVSSIPSTVDGSICVPLNDGFKKYNQDVCSSTVGSITAPVGVPLSVGADGSVSAPSVPFGKTWGDISGDFTYTPTKDVPIDTPVDTPVTGDTTGTLDKDTGVFSIPILGDILKVLLDILSFLKGLVGSLITGLITALKELLTTLFVPDASFVKDRFISLEADLVKKFPVDLTLISDVGKTSDKDMDFIYHFTIFGVYLTLDINFIKQVAPYSRMVANGLVAIFLVWYHFRKIIWLIRGSSPIGGDSHTGQINISVDNDIKRLN